jgi:acyl-CoA synthetase (AMP-forming)/AMP-acid ligase II
MAEGLPLGGSGSHPAVVDDQGTALGYDALAAAVDARAASLGSDAGGLMALRATNTVATVVDLLACWQAGVAAMLIGPTGPGDLERLVEAYRPDAVVGLDVGAPDPAASGGGGPGLASGPTALLLPTSGSTGSPKFVRLSMPAVVASATGIVTALDLSADERGLANLPLHYSYGLSIVLSHLVCGATVVLTGHSAVRPEHWQVVRDQRVTSIPGVPYSYVMYRRVGLLDMDLPHLRSLTQAGGRLEPAVVVEVHERLAATGRRLFVMYGQTEATSRMSVLDPADLPDQAGSVGRPVPGGAFEIAEPDSSGVGEVIYTGPNVMLGYAEGRVDLGAPDQLGRVLATGDLGRLDGDGRLWLTGRVKRIVKLFGERVSLDDIEDLAGTWGPAAAFDDGADRLGIVVEGAVPDDAARTVERRLGVPPGTVRVRSVEALPRTTTGKIDYTGLSSHG